jgi:hypothetical protein
MHPPRSFGRTMSSTRVNFHATRQISCPKGQGQPTGTGRVMSVQEGCEEGLQKAKTRKEKIEKTGQQEAVVDEY